MIYCYWRMGGDSIEKFETWCASKNRINKSQFQKINQSESSDQCIHLIIFALISLAIRKSKVGCEIMFSKCWQVACRFSVFEMKIVWLTIAWVVWHFENQIAKYFCMTSSTFWKIQNVNFPGIPIFTWMSIWTRVCCQK